MNWFRFYSDVLDDTKLVDLNDKQYRIMTLLMAYACELRKKGAVPFCIEKIAWRIRHPVTEVEDAISRMKDLKILQDNGAGIEFINWKKWQYESDLSTPRVQKHRQKRGETFQERFMEQDKTVTETPPDTDTDTDTDKKIHIPQKEIVNLYHEILPELPTVKAWTDKRRRNLRIRWNENKKRQNLKWWTTYFNHVRESRFLMGQKDDFKADIDFLLGPKLLNVIEGKYH